MTSEETSLPENTKSQTEVVIQGIKEMLTSGELSPRSRLPIEKDLANQLGVSRGSLREGIRALAALGIVETKQGDGTYVTSLDAHTLLGPLRFLADTQQPANATDLLAVRRVLESESAALAAKLLTEDDLSALQALLSGVDRLLEDSENLDLEAVLGADIAFHNLIARACGNPPLGALIESLGGRTHRARLWRAISEQGAIEAAHADHKAIYLELLNRESDRARIRMAGHLLGMEEFTATHQSEDPEMVNAATRNARQGN
jgi:DNA-binding FadR family transcriptional regulator